MNLICGKINGYNLWTIVSDLLEEWSNILFVFQIIYDLTFMVLLEQISSIVTII